jgi:hypothetical protein
LLTKLSTQSHVNFVSVGRFFCLKFDDHSLLVFHDTIFQPCFKVIWPKQSRLNPIREGPCRNDHIKTRPGTKHLSPALMIQARENLRCLAHVLIHQMM